MEVENAGAAAAAVEAQQEAARPWDSTFLDELPSKEAARIHLHFELSYVFLPINNFLIVIYF
jgi:hypothetical protein